MSNRRKNNHYHYSEKFDDKNRSSSKKNRVFMPFKSVIISLLVLLMFGLVCTTFSTYVSENDLEQESDVPSVMVQERRTNANKDIAFTGADSDLASSGGNVTGGIVVVEVPSTWTSYSHIQFGLYQNGYLWCSDDMTRITNTNFYYASNPAHGSWSNEQIMFMANNSHFGSGNFDGTNSAKYSGKITQAMSSNYYTFWLSGSANAYTNTYKGNFDSLANAIYVFNQTANIYTSTNGTAASNYSSSGAGGNVEITASYLNESTNTATQTTTPSSNGGTSVTYERAVYHTSVTFKATANSGYRFVGWYASTTTTSATSTSATYTISSLTGANTLYARFIRTYTVTVQAMSGYTGTAPTGTTTVDAGNSVTVTATTPQGVNFTGWTVPSGATYTAVSGGGSSSSSTWTFKPTSTFTLTANYSLKPPKNLNLTYASYKILGYTDTYGPTAHSAQTETASGSGSSITYSYTIAQHSSKTVNLTNGTDYSVNASSGAVSASVPGKYVVTMTATDSCYGLTSTATKNATVEVKPVTPSFTYNVYGYTGGIVEGTTGTSATYPYKIPISRNGTSSFRISSGLTGITGYTYNWSTTDGTTTAVYSTTTASTDGNRITDTVQNPETVLHAGTAGAYTYTVTLVAAYNGSSSLSASAAIYYAVTADFLTPDHFNFDNTYDDPETDVDEGDTVQKIYAVDNTIDGAYAVFNAGGENFDTILFFSEDNQTYTPIQVYTDVPFTMESVTYSAKPNDAAHQTVQPYTVDPVTNYLIFYLPVLAQYYNSNNTQASDLVNVMQRSGVKYFRAYVDDFENRNTTAADLHLHTTVGTSSSGGARPIYFKESSGFNSPTDTRLMAYFLDADGEMTYQTAEDYNTVVTDIDDTRTDRVGIYRFYAPSDAVSVCFAYTTTNGYVLPTVNNGSLGFGSDNTVFTAYTGIESLDSDYNMYKATSYTTDANSMASYTGEWTNLDMDS